MRKFLDEVGSSSDEEERQGQGGEGGDVERGEAEQDQSMAKVEAQIQRLKDLEAAEEKR